MGFRCSVVDQGARSGSRFSSSGRDRRVPDPQTTRWMERASSTAHRRRMPTKRRVRFCRRFTGASRLPRGWADSLSRSPWWAMALITTYRSTGRRNRRQWPIKSQRIKWLPTKPKPMDAAMQPRRRPPKLRRTRQSADKAAAEKAALDKAEADRRHDAAEAAAAKAATDKTAADKAEADRHRNAAEAARKAAADKAAADKAAGERAAASCGRQGRRR